MTWVLNGTKSQYFRALDDYAHRLVNFYGDTYWRGHEDSSHPLAPQEMLFRYGSQYLMLKRDRIALASATAFGDWANHLYKYRMDTLKAICNGWSEEWSTDASGKKSGPFPVLESFQQVVSLERRPWYALRTPIREFNAYSPFFHSIMSLYVPEVKKRLEADKQMGIVSRDDSDEEDDRFFDEFIRTRSSHLHRTQ